MMQAKNAQRAKFDALDALIRDHASNKTEIARPRKLFKQLDDLRDPDWEMEWQESKILLSCHCRIKPARTHGNLKRLRDARHARGEDAQFDAFMELITSVLHPQFITPHGYNLKFAEMDGEKIFSSMGAALAPLEKLGKPVFIYAGTLLGLIRDNAPIDHDDDIDVGIILGELPRSDVAATWLDFKKELDRHGLIDDEERSSNNISFKFNTDLGVEVDLFPAWTENGKFSVYPYSLNELDEADILPLRDAGHFPAMLPRVPEALLAQSYGPEWITPDPLFHLNWPQKKKLFHHLLEVDYTLRP